VDVAAALLDVRDARRTGITISRMPPTRKMMPPISRPVAIHASAAAWRPR
jgi:hypothetical protein